MRTKVVLAIVIFSFFVLGCKNSEVGTPQDEYAVTVNEEEPEERVDMELSDLKAKEMDRKMRALLRRAVGNVKLVHFGKAPIGGWMHMYRVEEIDSQRALGILKRSIKEKNYKYCTPFGIDIVWLEGNKGARKLIRVAFPSIFEITVEYVIESENAEEFNSVLKNLSQMSEDCRKVFSEGK